MVVITLPAAAKIGWLHFAVNDQTVVTRAR